MAKQYSAPPPMTIDPKKSYDATITTALGDIVVHLLAGSAPVTVNNFVFLARDGFYDGVTFHRVIPDFMAQTGDPTASGAGGPGYTWNDEESALRLKHDSPGTLSMANAGRNTNGSQFFITFGPTPHLDGKHAVFGRVTKGMDVLRQISPRDPGATQPGDAIERVTIEDRSPAGGAPASRGPVSGARSLVSRCRVVRTPMLTGLLSTASARARRSGASVSVMAETITTGTSRVWGSSLISCSTVAPER